MALKIQPKTGILVLQDLTEPEFAHSRQLYPEALQGLFSSQRPPHRADLYLFLDRMAKDPKAEHPYPIEPGRFKYQFSPDNPNPEPKRELLTPRIPTLATLEKMTKPFKGYNDLLEWFGGHGTPRESSGIPIWQLAEPMNVSGARAKVIVLDQCFGSHMNAMNAFERHSLRKKTLPGVIIGSQTILENLSFQPMVEAFVHAKGGAVKKAVAMLDRTSPSNETYDTVSAISLKDYSVFKSAFFVLLGSIREEIIKDPNVEPVAEHAMQMSTVTIRELSEGFLWASDLKVFVINVRNEFKQFEKVRWYADYLLREFPKVVVFNRTAQHYSHCNGLSFDAKQTMKLLQYGRETDFFMESFRYHNVAQEA